MSIEWRSFNNQTHFLGPAFSGKTKAVSIQENEKTRRLRLRVFLIFLNLKLTTDSSVMTPAGLYIPNGFHFAVAEANEPVPTADHGILLAGYQQHLVTDL